MDHKRTTFLAILGVAVVTLAVIVRHEIAIAPVATTDKTTSNTTQTPAFDKRAFSTSDATSIWVIVNKQHPLNPANYVPAQLVIPAIPLRSNITNDEQHVSAVMAPALEQMAAAAKQSGVLLNLQSGYRSYTMQVSLYNSYANRDGRAAADRYSARPGYSEHQTGLAADLGGVSNPACNVEQCFATTPEGKWLAIHAYQFGFVIRYPAPKESVTGYEYEPWHVRYVGVNLSTEMYNEHIQTLEEFFGISGGTTYR